MLRTTLVQRWLVGFVLLTASSGCQSWQSSEGVIPGLWATKEERQIVHLAQDDPFPSPSEAGLKQSEDK